MGNLSTCQFPSSQPLLNCSSDVFADTMPYSEIVKDVFIFFAVIEMFAILFELHKHQKSLKSKQTQTQAPFLNIDYKSCVLIALLLSVFCVMMACFYGGFFRKKTFEEAYFWLLLVITLQSSALLISLAAIHKVNGFNQTPGEIQKIKMMTVLGCFGYFALFFGFQWLPLTLTDKVKPQYMLMFGAPSNIVLCIVCYAFAHFIVGKVIAGLEKHVEQQKSVSQGKEESILQVLGQFKKLKGYVKSITLQMACFYVITAIPVLAKLDWVFIGAYSNAIVASFTAPINIMMAFKKVKKIDKDQSVLSKSKSKLSSVNPRNITRLNTGLNFK